MAVANKPAGRAPRSARSGPATRRRTITIGVVILVVAAVVVAAIFQKPAIISALRPGETMQVVFPRDYKIAPYSTAVKIAGSPVGEVSGISNAPGGGVVVDLKVDNGTLEKLGTAPTAEIRPTTVLGGKYYISLAPGGDRGTFTAAVIPASRARIPVELDTVLAAIPQDAQKGLQGMTAKLDDTLQAGAGRSLDNLLADAPRVLAPTGVTLDALRGTNPDTDLLQTVTGLDATARVLTATPGQLASVVDSLATTSQVLGDNSAPLAQAISQLPDTLRTTTTGSRALSTALDKIVDVASDARPSVQELDPLLKDLDPTLAELRPVLSDLRPLLQDARPLVEQLTPTVVQGTSVLQDLNGPVLQRVNGPISDQILSEWHGNAPKYPNGGGDGNLYYQELGYMFAKLDNSTQYFNGTAHMLGFQPGVGTTSVDGTGPAAQAAQQALSQMFGPPAQPGSTPLQVPPAQGITLPDVTKGLGG